MNIKNNVNSGFKGKLEDFNDLQPVGFKAPYHSEITKKSILERGFVQPFAMCEIDEELFICDGHLRKDLIYELINDGHQVPEEFSYYLIDVNNDRKKAIDILFSFNTKTNPIDLEVLTEWVNIEQVEVEVTSLNVVDIKDISDSDEFGTDFSLPDGDKAPFQQMTFTLADEQAEQIKNAISDIKQTEEYKYAETMGNENSNGNALYLIIMQWAGQRK